MGVGGGLKVPFGCLWACFYRFGRRLRPKGGSGNHLEGKRGFARCPEYTTLSPRVAQGTPRGADSHQKSAQRNPERAQSRGNLKKIRKLRHLDFDRHYGGLAAFTPFGEDRDTKQHKQIITENKTTHVHRRKQEKNTTSSNKTGFGTETGGRSLLGGTNCHQCSGPEEPVDRSHHWAPTYILVHKHSNTIHHTP